MMTEVRPDSKELTGSNIQAKATAILRAHLGNTSSNQNFEPPYCSSSSPIKVVCISDTHNNKPILPPGDILIHAGDLTDGGSFQEIQDQLNWLGSLPHKHKFLVAGNHDVLFDSDYLKKYPQRRYGSRKTKEDLIWPKGLIYLQDESVTISVKPASASGTGKTQSRMVKIYGSPYTPQTSASAFQYSRDAGDLWHNKIPSDADIVVTHGPGRLLLDMYAGIPRGCPFLTREIARVKPKLHLFGHIHSGRGANVVVFNGVWKGWLDIQNGLVGGVKAWLVIVKMWLLGHVWYSICSRLLPKSRRDRATILVNAASVSWNKEARRNTLRGDPITVVEI